VEKLRKTGGRKEDKTVGRERKGGKEGKTGRGRERREDGGRGEKKTCVGGRERRKDVGGGGGKVGKTRVRKN
jgi:hypothetical protein